MKTLLLAIALLTGCDKTKIQHQTYVINNATSVAEWKGSTLGHAHSGSFQVKGSLSVVPNGQLEAGSFQIPIAPITNFDLLSPVKEQLLDQLKSSDFFNLLRYPEATFNITQVTANTGISKEAVPGTNRLITGDFTMLGENHPITFPAIVHQAGDSLRPEARFAIDCTRWGMNSYSDPKQPMYILPQVSIQLTIRQLNSDRMYLRRSGLWQQCMAETLFTRPNRNALATLDVRKNSLTTG